MFLIDLGEDGINDAVHRIMTKEATMARQFGLALILFSLLVTTAAYGEGGTPLGRGTVALQVSSINFTDGELEDLDVDSETLLGLAAYFNIRPNLYIGGEIGFANLDESTTSGGFSLKTDVDYVPMEFNLKYVTDFEQGLMASLGGGFSLNYVDGKISQAIPGAILVAKGDELLLGAQIFLDLVYRTGNLFFGANLKYQLTEELDDLDFDFSNFRIGGQIGLVF